MNANSGQSIKLNRSLGFWALVAFGVGDILGAGIYALVGRIANLAGYHSWLAFMVALGVAAFTALSYAELSSRLPTSGGEAAYTHAAFSREWLSFLIGWMVLCSGLVSMATVSRAFSGYISYSFPAINQSILIIGFLLFLTVVNTWGIRQSSALNLLCTGIELCGLFLVIGLGIWFVSRNGVSVPVEPVTEPIMWSDVLKGGALAFFAFIGFEDMVNVSEEVKTPNMAKAILTALGIAGVIYLAVTIIAVCVIPPAELAASSAPLLEVVLRAAPVIPAGIFTLIAVFAISNTALLNYVMGSRLIYGMAQQRLLPAPLGTLHSKFHTPYIAIFVMGFAALVLALKGSLEFLAGTTSVLLLGVFIVVNVGLIVIKRRDVASPSHFNIAPIIPYICALSGLGLMAFVSRAALFSASVIVLIGFGFIVLRVFILRKN